jgi:hypothetical protein
MNRAMDWDQFQRLSERGNFIPVYQQWPADLDTPVSAWYRVCRGQPYSFLLEVPPSGGSLEIGNFVPLWLPLAQVFGCPVPPSGGSLEIGNYIIHQDTEVIHIKGSPFGGIPRNWKP